jgi:uncharacterized protein (TIGR03437 family)
LVSAVNYTITSSPSGLQITIDGQAAGATPVAVPLQPGTQHQITAPSPQSGGPGVQYVLSASQAVTAACGPAQASVAVNFQTQYALSITSDVGGSVAPAAGFQNAGASVTLSATPQSGFVFAGWEGACTGSGTCTLQMSGPMSVKADFAPATALSPALASVVGAGLSTPSVTAISPNGIAIAFGSSFAPAGTLSIAATGNLVNGNVSTDLGGVCVLVGSTKAPILAVTPSQVNFQVPQGVTPGPVSVQVVTGCGTANPQQTSSKTVTLQSASPEFFYFAQGTSGQNPIAAVDDSTGVYVGTPGLLPGGTFAPAKAGDVVTLYATGLGVTNPNVAAGQLPGAATSITGTLQVTIGSTTLPAANVLYAGVAPATAGLYQINILLPATIASGNQPVQISVNGIASPAGPYITIK